MKKIKDAEDKPRQRRSGWKEPRQGVCELCGAWAGKLNSGICPECRQKYHVKDK